MKKSQSLSSKIFRVIGSKPFFWLVVGLLVVQAGWIALSGRYPMAFDEDFHLGLIRLYANHPNPFWSGDVIGGDAFGAVARDPSYLYHYLMSFPYRLIGELTSNVQTQVLTLRGLNIAFFASGLFVYRRLLLKTKASPAIANLCLLVFVLIPVTSLLAAQINYDNVFIPLTGLSLLVALNLYTKITKSSIDLRILMMLTGICIFASLIKYAFLPIALSIVVFIFARLWQKFDSLAQLRDAVAKGWQQVGIWTLAGLIGANILLGGLFIERYGVNLIKYHKPIVDCADVLTYEQCQHYGPWIRDYNLKAKKTPGTTSLISFQYEWFRGMWTRSFFAVAGPDIGFQTKGPFIVPGLGVLIFAVSGVAVFAWQAKNIWRKYYRPSLWLFLGVSIVYIGVLWIENYKMYNETGIAVAINGRYLLPVIPLLILLCALAFREITQRQPKLQLLIASIVIFAFAWGGGALTYVLRSNDDWYWQNQKFINSANHTVQNIVGPVVPSNYRSNQYLR